MLLLFGHLLHPGDEVVLSDPYYACYPNFIRYADGVPVGVGVSEEDGFDLGAIVAYLHEDQALPGWSVLVLKRPATELHELTSAGRSAVVEEVARIAGVLATKIQATLLGDPS